MIQSRRLFDRRVPVPILTFLLLESGLRSEPPAPGDRAGRRP